MGVASFLAPAVEILPRRFHAWISWEPIVFPVTLSAAPNLPTFAKPLFLSSISLL